MIVLGGEAQDHCEMLLLLFYTFQIRAFVQIEKKCTFKTKKYLLSGRETGGLSLSLSEEPPCGVVGRQD